MKRKTPQSLRADAAHLRKLAANALVQAEGFEREAVLLEEREEAKAVARGEIVRQWFDYVRKVRVCH